MATHKADFFTLDEVNRLKIIQDVVDRRLTTQMAAQRLGLSDRQCRRLLHENYSDFGPTLAAEKLRERHDITVLVETLRKWMTADGLWIPHVRRKPRVSKSSPKGCFI